MNFKDFYRKWVLWGASGSVWGGFGKRNDHWRLPFWSHGVTLVGLGLPSGSLWGALGETLEGKKATMDAPRRVKGLFGGPTGLWQGPGVIFGVFLRSKTEHFEGSGQNLEILLAGPIESQYFGFSILNKKKDDFR